MANKHVLPYLAVSFVMLVWGLSFLSIKVTVSVLGPMTLALSRFLIASVILYILLKIKEPKSRLEKQNILLMAVSGIIGITLYFFFENNGVEMTTASTASIIIGAIPMLTALADHFFCGNKLNLPKAAGVFLSFAGVYLIVRESGSLDFSSANFKGNLMMFGAAVSWVFYSLLTRPLGGRYSKLAITTYQTLFGTAAILPFALMEKANWSGVNLNIIANVAFLGILCSAAGYYFYVYAMGELGVSISSLFINFIPVVTVVSSYFILDEKITSLQMMGGAVIIASVYMADVNNWLKKAKSSKEHGDAKSV